MKKIPNLPYLEKINEPVRLLGNLMEAIFTSKLSRLSWTRNIALAIHLAAFLALNGYVC